MSMVRFLREIVREVAKLPLYVKILVSLGLLVNFIVITQWERLTLRQPAITAAPKMSISQEKPAQRSFDFPEIPAPDETRAAQVEVLLAKRMTRITTEEPNVQTDGSISANGQSVHLYGIKQFNSKQLCKRASGEPWACGLHAYAMLRNTIAKKTIVCDPNTESH
jgi:hypothetical protein